MSTRSTLLVAVAAAIAGASAVTVTPAADMVRSALGLGTSAAREAAAPEVGRAPPPTAAATPAAGAAERPAEGVVAMDDAQIREADIRVAAVAGGSVARQVQAPGTVVASADRLVRVPARVSGTVVGLLRRPGDQVARGDLLAVIESREIADAKAEYLAAQRAAAPSRVTFERERRLWDRRVTAEQDFIRARADDETARIRVELAQGKLVALGLGVAEIAALPRQPTAALSRKELRAPITGRVTERSVDLGGAVAPETVAFVVVDLSVVWVETAVASGDLAFVREGQPVTVAGPAEQRAEARLIFVSPNLDNATRAARAVAELRNPDGAWRPGVFVTATVRTGEQAVRTLVPREAVQTIGGESVVFVRTAAGFARRDVRLGRGDDRVVEVVSGLDAGEPIAVTNAFLLKAELAKGEASHED